MGRICTLCLHAYISNPCATLLQLVSRVFFICAYNESQRLSDDKHLRGLKCIFPSRSGDSFCAFCASCGISPSCVLNFDKHQLPPLLPVSVLRSLGDAAVRERSPGIARALLTSARCLRYSCAAASARLVLAQPPVTARSTPHPRERARGRASSTRTAAARGVPHVNRLCAQSRLPARTPPWSR